MAGMTLLPNMFEEETRLEGIATTLVTLPVHPDMLFEEETRLEGIATTPPAHHSHPPRSLKKRPD